MQQHQHQQAQEFASRDDVDDSHDGPLINTDVSASAGGGSETGSALSTLDHDDDADHR